MFINMVSRNFYEDDRLIETKPGENVQMSSEFKEKESAHGNISFVTGMGIRTTASLEQGFHKVRQQLNHYTSLYSAEFSTQLSSLTNEFDNIKREVTGMIKEPLLPSSIYVLTATLTGSIFSSRRTVPVRLASPIFFGGIAFRYFLPYTFKAVEDKLLASEKKHFPGVFSLQEEYAKKISDFKERAYKESQGWHQGLVSTVHRFRMVVEGIFSDKK